MAKDLDTTTLPDLDTLDATALRALRDTAVARLGNLERVGAAADAPLPEGATQRVVLPSGAVAVFFKRKGRALMQAQRAAGSDTSRMMFALLAQMVEIDGRAPLMEDLEDMDLMDVMKLQEVFTGLGEPGRTPAP